MTQLGGVPVLVLREGATRTRGRDALNSNIMASKVIEESIKSSLGPMGMDKMLVSTFGDVVVTNDGATILKEIDVQHPAAKFIVELAKVQDQETGDGTTTVVIIAGELLRAAEELLGLDIHPTVITDGYRKAAEKALKILDEISKPVAYEDDEMMKKVSMTALASKMVAENREYLTELALKAVKSVVEEKDGKLVVDIDDIKTEKKMGEGVEDTKLVSGVVLDKEWVHPRMSKKVVDAKIALIDAALEVKKTEITAKINITDPDQIKAFMDEEESMIKAMVDKVVETGANVLVCQKGIDDVAQHFLAKSGVAAVRRVKRSDMDKLSKATGGKIVNSVEELTAEDFGKAGVVEERKVGEEKMIFVEECANPKSVSLLIRGGTDLVVDEVQRGLHDALCVIRNVIQEGKVVSGGGAPEMELSRRIRRYADTLIGREQLAVRAFAEALEIVPRTLAENAGLDPTDITVELRAAHDEGKSDWGVDVMNGKASDMTALNVWEPVIVKKHAIKSANEAAVMILRIDDVIATKEIERGGGGVPGGEEEEGPMDMGMD
ncbi:MAG: thermosome subunit alpha [Candidatus Wukongarchaeota archaeon]|nr:thermosome subunit alpha [Candidatus Wukongarchaeota archaeon]